MKTEFWMKHSFLKCVSPKVEGECHTKRRTGTMQRQGLMTLRITLTVAPTCPDNKT